MVKSKDTILVVAQMLVLGAYAFFDRLSFQVDIIVGYLMLALTILGVIYAVGAILQMNGSTLSPFPTPKRNAQLVTTGFFAKVRHPIYFGLILSTLSFSLFSGSGTRLICSLLLLILLDYKSKYEEELLLKKYKQYELYQMNTGRLFPKI